MPLRILYQDEDIIAVDKPAGFYVHPPEDTRKISPRKSCLHILRDQLARYVYPVHRLDRATSGVLLFAQSSAVAHDLHALWKTQRVRKVYACLTRGFLNDTLINEPLATRSGDRQNAETQITALYHKEIPVEFGKFPTARYTLALATPITGRFHQIRRHLAHQAHPIIGDKSHGDSAHNRYFENSLSLSSLYLRAMHLSFPHPRTGALLQIEAKWNGRWHKLFDWLGFCPTIKR